MQPKRLFRSGLTIVEVIIAATIMTVLLTVVIRIFRGSTYAMKAGMWTTNAQNQVRNTLTFLRDEIGRASGFATVTEAGVTLDPDPKFKLQFKSGTIGESYDGTILKFYQCRSAITISSPADPGAQVYCEFIKQGNKLIVNKQNVGGGATDEKLYSNKVLLEDVSEIRMASIAAMLNEQMAKSLLTIVLTVKDPKEDKRIVMEETKAKVDVEVVGF